ncbi:MULTISPECIES: hypothetical protein [Pseudomonadati]|uniref:Uncharacterized protein n=1 Tax=Shewanella aestuarii TaxID=1028752 RepID=A0ABT0KYV0_9GAMM|nr:hypothetical protein [Shewanella aestuarii]MCL1116595.1 hypothetical protein [Shewanella aestuarii]GGN72267.1 hypothetical protein GCM10009193_09030 [Shewanella aestuarii]
MSESKSNAERSNFASDVSTLFASGLSAYIISGIELPYVYLIDSFDIVKVLASAGVFGLFFYPFSQFFRWLYSDSKNR